MPDVIALLREGRTEELWGKYCGFSDLSLGDFYAHIHNLLPTSYSLYQILIADVLASAENGTGKTCKILYVGRGSGNYPIELGRRECDLDSLDYSGAVLVKACLKSKNLRVENVEFRKWGVEKGIMIYPDSVFDCVLSVHALHDLEKIDITINEYFRVLKASKGVILAEPQYSANVYPIHDLKKGQLRRKLEAVGFRINNITPANLANSDVIAVAVKPRYHYEANGYKFLSAETREDLEKVFRLRYQVYCLELGVEPENDCERQEDIQDEYAVHFLALDENNKPVGTLRALPNNPKGFPMESDFPLLAYMKDRGIHRAVEGGRFAIVKALSAEARANVGFGLMKGLIDYCKETGINDIFNTTQLKIVKRFAVTGFHQIGEPFEYPGLRRGVLWVPMHCDIREVYDNYSGTVQGYSELP